MTTQLEQELGKLKQGDHACFIYENAAEQMAVVVPFIVVGLARGEQCLCIADDRPVEAITQALADARVNVACERRRGSLRMLTKQDAYLKLGQFDPQSMIDFFRSARAQALAEGFSGLRVAAKMTWARRTKGYSGYQ